MTDARDRVFNFSAGPATMPVEVLESIRDEMLCYPGVGASVMEISHRSEAFVDILSRAELSLRKLIGIDDQYSVLFLQGGSGLQFSMVPANLLRDTNQTADYLVTGSWSKKAIAEARKEGDIRAAYDSSASNFDHVPTDADLSIPDDSAYLYYCSNETIQGVQFQSEPECPAGVPRVCDVSSDFLSRPIDIQKYGLLYACAQKNAGPAGVTVVVVRKDLMARSSDALPGYLNYRNHDAAGSMWNTPPTFAVYALGKVVDWLIDNVGTLDAMQSINERKAAMLYDVIDQHPDVYLGHAKASDRSKMNVTFKLADESQLPEFLSGAKQNGMDAMKGHRSVGGIRASLYNAMPIEGVEALASYMKSFAG